MPNRLSGPFAFFSIFLIVVQPTFGLDLYNLTKDTYTVPISGNIGANIVLGLGLNLDEPNNPIPEPRGPFVAPELAGTINIKQEPIQKKQIFNASTSFIEDQSDYEFSHALRANMNASFSFASGNASLDYIKEVKRTSDVILAIISQSTTSPQIPASRLVWNTEPSSEQISDKGERLQQFVADYGSHYVQTIRYGFKIAIYGRKQTNSETERQEFRAAFKAAFGQGAGGGSIDDTTQTRLKTDSVELRAEVTGGGIEPEGATVFNKFEDIVAFLNKLQQQQVMLYEGPIEVIAKSYWHTLGPYPKSRQILTASIGRVEAPFGVPRGAILSWNPPSEAMTRKADGSVDLTLPEGWALCDGSGNTPDLTGKFIMGSSVTERGQVGGSVSHGHNATSNAQIAHTGPVIGVTNPGSSMLDITTVVSSASSLPPHYKLVFLMRL